MNLENINFDEPDNENNIILSEGWIIGRTASMILKKRKESIAERIDTETIYKEGTLIKEGGSYKSWKSRFCQLREADLRYFKVSSNGEEKIEKGIIKIADIEMLGDLGNYKGRKGTIFALQTPTRTFYLEAESPEDKKAWLDAIRQRLETWSKHRDKEGNVKSKTQEIEAATIPKLISKITDPDFSEQNPFIVKDFLYTFPSFMTTQDLLNCMTLRWKKASNSNVKKKIISFLGQWLSQYWKSDFDRQPLQEPLKRFLDSMIQSEDGKSFDYLMKLIEKMSLDQATVKTKKKMQTPETLWKSTTLLKKEKIQSLLDFHPEEVARQLSLIEHKLFSSIELREFLNQVWNKKEKEIKAKNLIVFIERFNNMSKLIILDIIQLKVLEDRVKALEFWIEVANKCKSIGNYTSLMQIIAALNSTPIGRLKATWKEISSPHQQLFSQLEEVTKTSSNFKELRKLHQSVDGPCNPYIGMYLSDLTFIDEGNPSTIKSDMINFSKFRLIARILERLQSFQENLFPFDPVDFVQDYLSRDAVVSEEDLYKLSLEAEPKGTETIRMKKTPVVQTVSRNLKTILSNKAKRFQIEVGLSQDIIYINDRVILMGFPRKINSYVAFLEETHSKHYTVYNLCEDCSYDKKKFSNRVKDFPIIEHEAPVLQVIQLFNEDLSNWLSLNPLNVGAVHCKGKNKDRTVMMLSCWLVNQGMCYTPSHAVQYVNEHLCQNVELSPSQFRYISYIETLARKKIPDFSCTLILEKIVMNDIPNLHKKGFDLFFCIGKKGKQIYKTKETESENEKFIQFDVSQQVTGDIKIHYFQKKIVMPIFSISLHIAFIQPGKLRLLKRDIDGAHADRAHKLFPKDWKVELYFKEIEKLKPKNVPLDLILDSFPYRSALHNFLSVHGGVERLNFLTDEKSFISIPPSNTQKLRSDSGSIYQKYSVTPLWDSEKGENIKKNIEQRLETPEPNMFHEASEFAYESLKDDDLPKFVISNTYQRVKAPTLVEDPVPTKGPTCAQCLKVIEDGDSVVIGDFFYHWNCMQCSVCKKKQVDSNTCVIRGRQLTCSDCEKHLFVPCAYCGKAITTKSYAKIAVLNDRSRWHRLRWHYLCFFCSEPGCGSTHALKVIESKLYCPNHFPKTEQNENEKIEKTETNETNEENEGDLEEMIDLEPDVISEDEEVVKSEVQANEATSKFSEDNLPQEEIKESKKEDEVFNPPLKPQEEIPPSKEAIPSKTEEEIISFHEEESATEKEEDPDSLECYELSPPPQIPPITQRICPGCEQPISGQFVILDDDVRYHDKCFTCYHCKVQLTGQYAPSLEHKNRFFCVDHVGFAVPPIGVCNRCGQQVLRGVPYLIVADTIFHENCFTCNHCNKPIVQFCRFQDKYYCNECITVVEQQARQEKHFFNFKETAISSLKQIQEILQSLLTNLMRAQSKEEILSYVQIGRELEENLNQLREEFPLPQSLTPSQKEDKLERLKSMIVAYFQSGLLCLDAFLALVSSKNNLNDLVSLIKKLHPLIQFLKEHDQRSSIEH